jgi:hypothetical protein
MKEIPLTKGKIALVDDADYERVVALGKWCASQHSRTAWYAKKRISGPDRASRKIIIMHRFILGLSEPRPLVDHVNGNGLDNRRENLRLATQSQNQQNRGPSYGRKLKGVCFDKSDGRWLASIRINGISRSLGRFGTPEEAARAYDAADRRHFGAFARLNFPVHGEVSQQTTTNP